MPITESPSVAAASNPKVSTAGAFEEKSSPSIRSAPDELARVLLVDDEVRNLEVLESILESPGLQLVRAQTPEEALLALVQGEFACLVLDVQMPGMSGFDLAALIKTRKRCNHIPIIFLTAFYQDKKDILQGYGAGAVDYLTKPIDSQILKSKVGVFVELFRSNRTLVAMNNALELEVAHRQKAEEALSKANAELATVNRSLRHQIREREQLEATVLNISEHEQQRIGRDIHDGLCQYLTGLKFKSALLEQKLIKVGLSEAADARRIEVLLSQAIEHARHLARGLNPIRLQADGLTTALTELAASIASLFSVSCTFSSEQPIPPVDHAHAIHLYRIAQEATSNAIKHGKATRITMRLFERPEGIQLVIEDNGQGLPAEPSTVPGTGLHIMDYRARTIGALLDVKAIATGGVAVTCTLARDKMAPPAC
jgi:signal transduction histidine kinase